MNLQRAGELLCMAVSPGMPADMAHQQALDLLVNDPSQVTFPPGRKPGVFEQLVCLCSANELPQPLCVARVLPATLRVHVAPACASAVIDELCAGDQVAVWRQIGDWVFVGELEGCRQMAGWVVGKFLRGVGE